MKTITRLSLGVVLWLILAFGAAAQNDDKGFLTRAIQDALSGTGRSVNIEGFAGALSSTASFDTMTIADDDGIWLTLRDVELVWTRSALLRGRLEVERLTARSLDLPRLPVAQPALPDAEAAAFALPDLPVSIDIQTFTVEEITLGSSILGEATALRVQARAQYRDDVLDVDISAERVDGKKGRFDIKAGYERGDTVLRLLLQLSEAENGIAARLLNLPDKPSVDLTVEGNGPIDAFETQIVMATQGQERLTGVVSVNTQAPRRASDTPDRRLIADVGGDITTLLAPQYRAFFGTDLRLKLDGVLEGNGTITLDDFDLRAKAAALSGSLALNADKWPTSLNVTGRVMAQDGTPVQLPVSGPARMVQSVDLQVAYDAAEGDALSAAFEIAAFSGDGVAIEGVSLTFDGTLLGTADAPGQLQGAVQFASTGLAFVDQGLARAVGPAIRGQTNITLIEGQPIRLEALSLGGADYALRADAQIDDLETGFATELLATLTASDLSRFSDVAGQSLVGKADLSLDGRIVPLSGQFDLAISGKTEELALGIPQADAVLAGTTDLRLNAKRNATGTFVEHLDLRNDVAEIQVGAQLRSEDSRVKLSAKLREIALVVPELSGPVALTLSAVQDIAGWSVYAQTDGPYGAALTAKGLATGPDAALRFTADVPNIQPFVPQVQGPARAQGTVRQSGDGYVVDATATGLDGGRAQVSGLATGPKMRLAFEASLPSVRRFAPGINGPLEARGIVQQTPQGIAVETTANGPYSMTAAVDGIVTGPQARVTFDAFLPNVGSLVEKITGPLRLTGNAAKQGSAWRVDTQAQGPSGTQARLNGLINNNGTVNLGLKGTAPLGLSRPFIAPRNLQGQAQFDLAVNGAPALASVTGVIETNGAQLSAPNLRVSLEGILGQIRLARNRANIDLRANGTSGGTLDARGSVVLSSSLPADLQVSLNKLTLIDPRLYRTALDGDIRIAGPLAGGANISGRIEVGETTVNVPSTGLTSIGEIPNITHLGDHSAQAATRRKAAITGETDAAASKSTGAGYGLDLGVNAPRRIFVRGRGIDAELGGALRLTGSTTQLISAGRFELLRGRLDILGKRFDLVEGSIQFQGDLIPYLRFVSTATTSIGNVNVIVEGPADAPEVSFTSSPAAPQDEVLAQLLFGRNLADISAFQALQLANAVATLAGRGGGGIISNLRDGFGLDDLDVTTTDDGDTAVRVGKYLTDNVYTDVTASSDGTGEVSLNLDITPNLKGKVSLGSDGNSGIGVFFEKDY